MNRRFAGLLIAALVTMAAWRAGAVAPKTIEDDWTFDSYYAKSSAASSTHSITGVGFSYAILSSGTLATYSLHHTTRTFRDGSGFSAIIASSVYHEAPAGIPVNGEFRALTENPKIIIHDFPTSSTVQVWIEYGVRRRQ